MIYLCPTYDYELFLGGSSYTEKEVLIDQTDILLDIYEKREAKLTLFADVWSLIKYRELGQHEFPNLADNQMKDALRRGNDVQLHIHPQWVNAKRSEGKWEFNKREYSLGDFEYEDNSSVSDREVVVRKAVEYLEDTLKEQMPGYDVIAYRAGGYCSEPFEDNCKILHKYGIVLDSSVVAGLKKSDYPITYDYSDRTNNVAYHLDGNMMELPLGTVRSFREKCYYRMNYPIYVNNAPRGYYITSVDKVAQSKVKKLINKSSFLLDSSKGYMMTFDERRWDGILYLMERILKGIDYVGRDVILTMVGHPKVLNERLIDNTDRFLTEIRAKYGNDLAFATMTDIWKMKFKK